MQRIEIASLLHNATLFLLGLALLTFPVAFATLTSDPYGLPKQVLLAAASLLGILLVSLRFLAEGKITIRRTPYDVPVLLFLVVVVVSVIFSRNRMDALISAAPIVFAIGFFFAATNTAKDKMSSNFLKFSFLGGAVLLSLATALSYFKIFLLPFAGTKVQTFTPAGSLLDAAIYLGVASAVCFSSILPTLRQKRLEGKESAVAGVLGVATLIGFATSLIALVTIAKPTILPFQTGFQTAFAEISQDAGRLALGFFFGSGFGTYLTDFTRFKPAAYNQDPQLWSLTFVRSSSFVLELLATTGVLGIASYLFLVFKIVKVGRFMPLVILVALSFVIPFSFVTQVLIFFLLALASTSLGLKDNKDDFYDWEIGLVANKKRDEGFIASLGAKKALPSIWFVLAVLIIGFLGFYSTRYVMSDILFQRSLVAASKNNGTQTYQLQQAAIRQFPRRDVYLRVFSQTNFALANSLASSVPKGSSPSAQVQSGVTTLIQQSINSGRQATVISPLTSVNWQQLAAVYRGLFGFGQNAEAFAVQTMQQAIVLDPNNPQLYVNLGGIYYQLGRYENAQQQFLVAISLKSDFANAHYNLAHTLRQKGQLDEALKELETVKTLVQKDKNNLGVVEKDIENLKNQIASGETATAGGQPSGSTQPPLGVSGQQQTLPPQNPPVKIPAPNTSTESAE